MSNHATAFTPCAAAAGAELEDRAVVEEDVGALLHPVRERVRRLSTRAVSTEPGA